MTILCLSVLFLAAAVIASNRRMNKMEEAFTLRLWQTRKEFEGKIDEVNAKGKDDTRLKALEADVKKLWNMIEDHDNDADKVYREFLEGVNAIMNYMPGGNDENILS